MSTRDLKEKVLTEDLQIAERSRKYRDEGLTNLHQYITLDRLQYCLSKMNKGSSAGVDKQSWGDYNAEASERLPELLRQFKTGQYRAPHIRRVYIPKECGDRPLGIPTTEDKVLQSSVAGVLEAVYEEEFKDFSHGFRPKRDCHKAIYQMSKEVSFGGQRYIIDADIQRYFESIPHGQLRELLDRRVKDGVIRKMLDKWLKAGILEDKQLYYPEEGTPQGGTISPLLSNIYLHYVLDLWFDEEIRSLLKGKSFMVRYADDFVMGFKYEEDAHRVLKVLSKRFAKYGLSLHPEKTKLIDLNKSERGKRSFDFLGFTHYMGKSQKGRPVLKRKTRKQKLHKAITNVGDWIRSNRNMKLKDLIDRLNVKMRGHYNYYGVTFNGRSLNQYFGSVTRILHKWLNRRGGKPRWTLERFRKLIREWTPLVQPKIYHTYQKAKPI